MTLRLYNTLTRTKQDFVPLDPKNVRMYVCGPTVYDYAHIGNARPVIVFDVLFRLLRHLYGADHVTYVRNITDIDDKINARALDRRGDRNVPILDVVRELTTETARIYDEDVAALGNLPPTHAPRATDHIPAMIQMIEEMIANGCAYVAEGHVLFDVSKKADYGKLARRSVDDMVAGSRVEVAPYKKSPMDFVLWKPSDDDTPGWDSPWGRGRPGWHLECSAMSGEYLGDTFDIHGGGIDLVFPHHENEIAQSECAHKGAMQARVWMHNGHLNVEGAKMSKSLGNFVTMHDLLEEFPGGALRLAMLQTHYRQPMNWTRDKIESAWEEIGSWTAGIYGSPALEKMWLRKRMGELAKPHASVVEALNDDLNTSDAVTALRALANQQGNNEVYSALIETCEFLGLIEVETVCAYSSVVSTKGLTGQKKISLSEIDRPLKIALINHNDSRVAEIRKRLANEYVTADIHPDSFVRYEPSANAPAQESDEVQTLIDARNAARKKKDFKEADRIRDELDAKGIVLKDGPDGTTWEVKR